MSCIVVATDTARSTSSTAWRAERCADSVTDTPSYDLAFSLDGTRLVSSVSRAIHNGYLAIHRFSY